MSELASAAIIPSILQEIGTMTVDVLNSFWIGNGDVIGCNTDVCAKVFVRFMDCQIVLVVPVLIDAP